ncbi:flavin reductase [Thermocatellispora tengchongensis]|uniref:flavin reductase n=1 Tax=Thermocatellispora tengchongensis TaxID=1073253 RepID=UPI0036313EDC
MHGERGHVAVGGTPLLVVSLSETSRTLPAIRESGRFGVSLLSRDQRDLCERFAHRPRTSASATTWPWRRGTRSRSSPTPAPPRCAGPWITCRTPTTP